MVRVHVKEMVDDAVLLARAQAEIVRLKLQLKRQESEQVKTLREEVETLKSQLSRLKTENNKLTRRNDKLRKEKKEKKALKEDESRVSTPKHRVRSFASSDTISDSATLRLEDLRQELGVEATKLDESISSYNVAITQQAAALDEIQQQKHDLEQQLLHVGREDETTKEDDETTCPICSREIEVHTDSELDACIEKEAALMESEDGEHDVPEVEPVDDEKVPPISGAPKSIIKTEEPTLIKKKGKRKKKKKQALSNPSSNQTHLKNMAPEGLNNSVGDIGLRLDIYKYRYDAWEGCDVVGYDSKRYLHCCQFDCGDKQWLDLSQRKFRLLTTPSDHATTQTRPVSGNGKVKGSRKQLTSATRRRLAATSTVYGL